MKTVKVRIALEVNETGQWQACGNSSITDFERALDAFPDLMGDVRRHFIEAEVPVPEAEPAIIAGTAVEETAEAVEAA